MVKVFVNGPGDLRSIRGRIDSKNVLDVSLFNTQYYKVWIKGKWSNQRKEVAPLLYLVVVAIEKRAFGSKDKIVVPKKTTLQLYLKTFIEKINSADLTM